MEAKIESFYNQQENLGYYSDLKVLICNNYVQVKAKKYSPKSTPSIRRLSPTEYVKVRTGEVCEYQHHTKTEEECVKHWHKRMEALIPLVCNNFSGSDFHCFNEVYITLTIKGDLPDYQKVRMDFKSFIEKLLDKYPQSKYLAAPEVTEAGRWHIHLLFKQCNVCTLFIPMEYLASIWPYGEFKIERLRNPCAFAKYLAESVSLAYDEKKHSRLFMSMYPKNARYPWHSRNVIPPEPHPISFAEYMEMRNRMVCTNDVTHEVTILTEDGKKKLINKFVKQEFLVVNPSKHEGSDS